MSRSTGWHSPAVPPVESASQPGENASEQPSGMCGCDGRLLQRDDVLISFGRTHVIDDAMGFPVDRL